MLKKIFIDGSAGTTGLRIADRLEKRNDISLIRLDGEKRKDTECRREVLNNADVAFLCLPDAAAVEAVSLIENPETIVIDTSTAHRTNPDWAYGFPELSPEQEKKIASSKRIAVPGCHASGFIALVYPLIDAGIIDWTALLTCFSVTGFSGGGKKMIAEYEAARGDESLCSPRQYALSQTHKHLPEMKQVTGLENEPVFCPVVSDYYSGMSVTVPVFGSMLKSGVTVSGIRKIYSDKYCGKIVRYTDCIDENGFIASNSLSGSDSMQIAVCGNEDRILLVSRYDNLGKGASGAAVECLNLVLGADKTDCLELMGDTI